MKKLVSLLTAVVLLFTLSACGKTAQSSSMAAPAPVSSEPEKPKVNPLTGLADFDSSKMQQRPVAVMVNNITVAQSVQAGLSQADIVYELLAEGGITRFMAVFKDISKISKVGTVRSARYSYVDLALGHDALYVHAGMDPTECAAHVKETGIDNFNLLTGQQSNYGKRVKNGKALEHTLYTTGELLNNGFAKLNYRRDLKSTAANWQDFAPEASPVTPAGGSCEKLRVEMSSSYVSNFTYNAETGKYKRFSGNNQSVDLNTGKQLEFKNILVLKTSVTDIGKKADYLKKTWLDGGEGFYVSNGGYVPIKWSKGAANSPLKITLTDGSSCTYNAGNTWVCLVEKTHNVAITGAAVSSAPAASAAQ